jgi:hypothetical protein
MHLLKRVITLSFALIIFSSSLFASNVFKYEIAVCAIFQNEGPYLKEWIEFHKIVGVKHFYLFNHLSEDNYKEVLEPYIKSGLVELIDWSYHPSERYGWNSIQCKAYNKALKLSKKQAKWVAFIDTDEFLFPVETDSLSEFLSGKDNAGIAVNWQMYGTSGIYKVDKTELMIEKLVLKAPSNYHENYHIKSIVRPKYVKSFRSPHHAIYKSGHYAINSNREIVPGAQSHSVLIDKIRINHYWSRDDEYFNRVKVPRRVNWLDGGSFERLSHLNSEVDLSILKYIPQLKNSL